MFPDLDKSTAYICRKSFNDKNLDICDADILAHASLYEELNIKKDCINHLKHRIAYNSLPGNDAIINVRSLLDYEEKNFVYMSYTTILGRPPEDGAVTVSLEKLKSDNSRKAKMEYLRGIAYSDEARKRNVVITGFDSINLNEILKYSDRELLENAYIKILFRKPDINGINHFLPLLRSFEYAPVEIIYNLRHSAEGEKCGVDILGLEDTFKKRIRRKKLTQIPVVGRIGRFIFNFFKSSRRINGLIIENYQLRDQLSETKKQFNSAIERTEKNFAQKVEQANSQLDNLWQQVYDIGCNNEKIFDEFKSFGDRFEVISDNYKDFEFRISTLNDYTHQIGGNISDIDMSLEATDIRLNELDNYTHQIGENISSISTAFRASNIRINELDGYAHQIGGNVLEINKALENYDIIVSQYVNEDKKTIQLLLSELFSLKAKINNLERAASLGKMDAALDTSSGGLPPALDTYAAIDYFDFENHFRGSREHVKKVQNIYLPYFRGKKNVFDLGCGRGEFTELLVENNIGVTGVDLYEPYVEYMKSLNLPVQLGDAVKFLESQKNTDGIFMGQVVEHISIDMIISVCTLAYEKLEDGCYLIMETPNPKSLAMFTGCFYMDPSHQRPIHPYTLKYIAEKAGFSKVDILYTESSRPPFDIPLIKENDPDFKQFNEAMHNISELLYGSQDYAVIAKK